MAVPDKLAGVPGLEVVHASASADDAVTVLLHAAGDDRRRTLDALMPIVYDTLRRLAHQQLRNERPGHTLGTTGLVHEAYAKLAELQQIDWRDRGQFFAAAAGAMRRILIDHAVARRTAKRGGGRVRVELEEASLLSDDRLDDALAVHEALERLEGAYPGAAKVAECRVFLGLTIDETAGALGLSSATVKRHWTAARAWLAADLAARAR